MLELADFANSGQTELWDGRTGEKFDREVTVGTIYMLKLHHLVEDKIHARSLTIQFSYSTTTRWKSTTWWAKIWRNGSLFRGLRCFLYLQEILTVKSDDVAGRVKVYETIVKGEENFESGIPESFNVLVKEIKALALNVELN